ncbi:NmrA family transcriptional regulator [Nocardia nova]|uniref:NmrA/HSCARG family protein n=1 Tax=Nocardia nova TaxID=37330 RepID=UPI000CE9F7B0|nr:NmrA/HSCARG family protein [Nocardia nova]PPJ14069.1 NmrA family transcriptional regulator [Nocardia nova]
MTHPPVLVLGATGGQGGAVADALLSRGVAVRAMVRDPQGRRAQQLDERGAELVSGSLDDRAALAAAMANVAGVFALTTPFETGVDAEVRQGRAIIGAAGDAGVPHLVFSSVASADQNTMIPHFESKAVIEQELTASGLPATVVAPTYFFDNALGGRRELLDGVLELPIPSDRPLQQLAREDLGQFVAHVLREPDRYLGERVELAGDAPTPADMAADIGDALGRPVAHRQTSLEAIGNPDMHAMWAFLDAGGYRVDIEALHRATPEVEWTSFRSWALRTLPAVAAESPRNP